MICIGHRGARGHEPENTLLSVRKALDLNVDWIEIDVYLVDGELIVFHDHRLERTTNGEGYLHDKSIDYLRSLDAGKGEKIPFLREVFETVNGAVGINVELKGPDTAQAAVAAIEEFVGANDLSYDQFLISSFNHPELHEAHVLQPKIPIGALTASIPLHYARFAQNLDAYSVNVAGDFVDRPFIEDAHARGLKVFAYTVNFPEDIRYLEELGVDGVFTDYPELITAVR